MGNAYTDLMFLKDTKGDGVADVREVYLQGLDNAVAHLCRSLVGKADGDDLFRLLDACQ